MAYERKAGSDVGARDFDPWPAGCEVHVEWGSVGAELAAARGDIVVVVDVLSFSTSVVRAVGKGATALSYSAAEIAAAGGREAICRELAALIVSRDRRAAEGEYSLSPASLDRLGPGDRLIFTSLNGAMCTSAAAGAGQVIVAALTNRHAAAGFVADRLAGGSAQRCTLVACGEHWASTSPQAGMRPGIEDLLGCGAIAAALQRAGSSLSVEAELAAAAFDHASGALLASLERSVSGRELLEWGFADDVGLAAELDTIDAVPAWDTTVPVREFRNRLPATGYAHRIVDDDL